MLTHLVLYLLSNTSVKRRRKWQPAPVFLPEESHGQGSLVGYNPQGHKELDTTEQLSTAQHRSWEEKKGRMEPFSFHLALRLDTTVCSTVPAKILAESKCLAELN